ncbi:Hypothetical protein HVIM_03996 [Roseomonas mucosa]|uniref:Uncharacterized protein n=1 Tax=Roseomonas mucosa TaxID=207340 RepID=A0A4Y1MTC5_9PROT|nr:Hypothetical protein RADP37_03996 [Roseomonas mucosa]QDD93427.1 Hypothetical protein HVIM_03996 [Roseomonas mucosa]QDD98529.1 Hypothetical protein ADP8_03996 [Roseomonas mucosa]UZO90723.1 Hypothetical protein RMP42_03996 [Roseomonas mucosa]
MPGHPHGGEARPRSRRAGPAVLQESRTQVTNRLGRRARAEGCSRFRWPWPPDAERKRRDRAWNGRPGRQDTVAGMADTPYFFVPAGS